MPISPSSKQGQIGFYQFEKNLGEGNFAKVKLATHTITKEKVAIKIIDKTKLDPATSQKLFREVRIMKLLNHPHIVKLYEVIDTPDDLYLVMEYVSGGEIFDYLVAHGKLKEDVARKYFRQIVSAVHYCHSLKVIHRDLKAENILLDDKFNIKIADFGFSTQFKEGSKLHTWCGSPPYACPELFLGKEYFGPEVDVWSLGVILFVLVCGALPFDGTSLPKLRAKIIAGKFKVPYYMSQECEKLIRRMIVVEPQLRIKVEDVKNEKWFMEGYEKDQEYIPAALELKQEEKDHVFKILDKIGIDKELVQVALRENTYNHYQASYYLIADREFKKHKFIVPIPESKPVVVQLTETLTSNEDKRANSSPVPISTDSSNSMSSSKSHRSSDLPEINEEEGPEPIGKPIENGVVQQSAPHHTVREESVQAAERVRAASAGRRRRGSESPKPILHPPPPKHAPPSPPTTHTVAHTVAQAQIVAPTPAIHHSVLKPTTHRKRSNTTTENVSPISDLLGQKENNTASPKEETHLPAIPVPKKGRDRSKTVNAAIENTNTESNEIPSKDSQDKSNPRSLRFTFSVSTTSSKSPDHLQKEVKRVMTESQIKFKEDGFIYCGTLEGIEFEVEICRIPRLSVNGLRIKRLSGNSWEYKNLVTALVSKMDI